MTHFFADDGEKIHVQVSGDGPPILMLHGWTASHHGMVALSSIS
jgi:non-heme chloroperoxidase